MREEELLTYLKGVYEGAGFRAYKMRKFEEYSLYLENRDFLLSDYVITFSDMSGKLLALKPDVTLSIVKGTRATREKGEKLYYLENVYRLDRRTHEYREIRQMGLEALGEIDGVQTLEVCCLALKSLTYISGDSVMDISHMGYLSALLSGVDGSARREILSALRQKSAWAMASALENAPVAEENKAALMTLIGLPGNFESGLRALKTLSDAPQARAAVGELEELYEGLKEMGMARRVRLDFSIANDLDYYTGIVFQGYMPNAHRAVLSGGRYDGLTEKFKRGISAMGFALYLSDLAPVTHENATADALVTYKTGVSPARALKKAEELRAKGLHVNVAPEGADKNAYSIIVEVS